MQEPQWVNRGPKSSRGGRQIVFVLRMAALYHNPRGSLTEMCGEIGCTQRALHASVARGHLSRGMAALIEKKIGNEDIFSCDKLIEAGLIR